MSNEQLQLIRENNARLTQVTNQRYVECRRSELCSFSVVRIDRSFVRCQAFVVARRTRAAAERVCSAHFDRKCQREEETIARSCSLCSRFRRSTEGTSGTVDGTRTATHTTATTTATTATDATTATATTLSTTAIPTGNQRPSCCWFASHGVCFVSTTLSNNSNSNNSRSSSSDINNNCSTNSSSYSSR